MPVWSLREVFPFYVFGAAALPDGFLALQDTAENRLSAAFFCVSVCQHSPLS